MKRRRVVGQPPGQRTISLGSDEYRRLLEAAGLTALGRREQVVDDGACGPGDIGTVARNKVGEGSYRGDVQNGGSSCHAESPPNGSFRHVDRMMFRSYAKSAFRSLLRNKVPSFINVVGLAFALGSSITVYLFLQTYYTLDTVHTHGERIVMVERVEQRGGEEQTWGRVPQPLGPLLAADLPQVERAVRMTWAVGDVRTAEANFEERIAFADADFFDVFTFPLQVGTPEALAAPGAVILSDAAARKYFGDADPMGRSLSIVLGDADAKPFTVAGVAVPFPDNASLRFDLLLPFGASPDAAPPDDWAASAVATFLLLSRPGDIGIVAAQVEGFLTQANAANPDAPIERFVFESLVDPAPRAYTVLQRPTEAPHPALSLIMIALAAFMMALSCFNYVNITLGSAARRTKEIGIRKVIGGTRRQLVTQFMAENLLLCALALVLGLAFAWLLLIPLFNATFVMQIGLSLTGGLGLWIFLVALLAFVGVASGAYPALYVASFQPEQILRGMAKLKAKRGLTFGLMTVQFVIACLAVITTVVLYMNGRFLAGQEWGYDPYGIVVVHLSDAAQFAPLRAAAAELASVRQVAGAQDHVGVSMQTAHFSLDDEAPSEVPAHEAFELVIGPGYAETMGLRLARGRLFDAHMSSDAEASAVVNEQFGREQGWTDPVGHTLHIDQQTYTVIGVVEDFLYDPISPASPFILRMSEDAPRFLVARTASGNEDATQAALEAAWERLHSGEPIEAFAQRDVFDAQLGNYMDLARSIGYFAALALLIACMGVYGLASQNVARRMKEVSIRKVVGATVPHLVLLINRVFVVVLTIAALVATVVVYGGLLALDDLDVMNLMPITPLPFLASYLLVLFTVALSVASQSRTLAMVHLADVLRRD